MVENLMDFFSVRKLDRPAFLTQPKELFPMVAFSFVRRSMKSKIITAFTRGNYSHAMWFHRNGFFASQGWRFCEIPVEHYLEKDCDVELWIFPTWPDKKRESFQREIKKLIDRNGFYDVLGIVGHAIHLPSLNFSFYNYCTEAVWEPFRIINSVERVHPTPKELRNMLPTVGGQIYGCYSSREKVKENFLENLPKSYTTFHATSKKYERTSDDKKTVHDE